jgi:hypothetical protein
MRSLCTGFPHLWKTDSFNARFDWEPTIFRLIKAAAAALPYLRIFSLS